jgi:uncharacterized protein
MEPRITLSSMPMALHWDTPPTRCDTDGAEHVRISSGPRTDLFINPFGDSVQLNSPRLIGRPPDGDFLFSARLTAELAGTFDAGGLLLWADDTRWAKLCFERSPAGENMVISVVTKRSSDDANAFVVDGTTVWLRIARLGRGTAFHASTDGAHWHFVRQFDLGSESVLIGLEVQSPMGEGCAVSFDEITFRPTTLTDLRNGS